jgi:hypothetical protein
MIYSVSVVESNEENIEELNLHLVLIAHKDALMA